MTERELEDLMRDYEAEVAAYKRLPRAEPTALLDRAVLTKARAAVGHAPHRAPRWIGLAASFAGVAIAAGVGWKVYEAEQQSRMDAMSQGRPARSEAFEVEVLPNSRRDREKTLEMAQMPPPPAAPPPPPIPPALASKRAPEPSAFGEDKLVKQEQPMAEPAPSAAAPVMVEEAARQRAEAEPHVRADHASGATAPGQRRNVAAAAAAGAGAPMDSAAVPAEADDARALGRVGMSKSREQAAAEPADAWLERIRQLVRERRYTEARDEVARFREAHPGVVIPMDLRRFDS